MESLTGRLLVATPALKDPNFERTVVLVGRRSGQKAVVIAPSSWQISAISRGRLTRWPSAGSKWIHSWPPK